MAFILLFLTAVPPQIEYHPIPQRESILPLSCEYWKKIWTTLKNDDVQTYTNLISSQTTTIILRDLTPFFKAYRPDVKLPLDSTLFFTDEKKPDPSSVFVLYMFDIRAFLTQVESNALQQKVSLARRYLEMTYCLFRASESMIKANETLDSINTIHQTFRRLAQILPVVTKERKMFQSFLETIINELDQISQKKFRNQPVFVNPSHE